jgi:hypothetical protein
MKILLNVAQGFLHDEWLPCEAAKLVELDRGGASISVWCRRALTRCRRGSLAETPGTERGRMRRFGHPTVVPIVQP